jgi:hydrogenase-4 component B
VTLFAVALVTGLVGVAAGAALPSRVRVAVSMALVSLACAGAFAAATRVALGHHVAPAHLSGLLPLSGADVSLDPLSAIFVLVAAGVGLAASLYTIGYAREAGRSRTATATYGLFVLSLLMVPAAASVATFMAAWELMALTSMLAILVEQRHRGAARSAALWYGAMTQAGAAAILLGLLLGAHGAGQGFAAMAAHAGALAPAARSAAFVLTLAGFASKAGAVPLHVWLPRAHPEAPSPVSALMSGAMVAMGVYGIVRVGADLLGGGSLWWWVVVVVLGALSALFGSLHTTTSSDLKRLLAYSTVDVMGLVLVGVGAAGALSVTGHAAVGRLALEAALMMVVAHGAFKGCLFLAAGSIERATGQRDLDHLGGLIRRLPLTAGAVILSALAITAVPAFSGFAAEWLLLQGLLHGFADASTSVLVALLVGVVAVALTAGLTAVAFVKAVGIGLLGRARSSGAAHARQTRGWMEVGLAILCLPSVAFGVAPGLVLSLADRAARVGLAQGGAPPVARGLGLDLVAVRGAVEPALVGAAVLATILVLWALTRLVARRGVRAVAPWGSGREFQTARMQYTATSFGEPLQRVFSDVLRPDVDLEVSHVAESKYYEQALVFQSRVDDAVERSLYRPAIRVVRRVGEAARRLPNGSVHRYLALGFLALLVILVVLA